MAGVALLALLTPVLATTSWGVPLTVTVRILQVTIHHQDGHLLCCMQGVLEAAAFPALNPLVAKWVMYCNVFPALC